MEERIAGRPGGAATCRKPPSRRTPVDTSAAARLYSSEAISSEVNSVEGGHLERLLALAITAVLLVASAILLSFVNGQGVNTDSKPQDATLERIPATTGNLPTKSLGSQSDGSGAPTKQGAAAPKSFAAASEPAANAAVKKASPGSDPAAACREATACQQRSRAHAQAGKPGRAFQQAAAGWLAVAALAETDAECRRLAEVLKRDMERYADQANQGVRSQSPLNSKPYSIR